MACASASPACTKPLSTTGRSLTFLSKARYTQPSPPCAMQPLITYCSATSSSGESCGRNEYELPQCGHHPSDKARPSVVDRPTGRPQFQQNRFDSPTTGLVINAWRGSTVGTRGISTKPPPRRRVGDSARVTVVRCSSGSVTAVPAEVLSESSSTSSPCRVRRGWPVVCQLSARPTVSQLSARPTVSQLSARPTVSQLSARPTG